MANKTKNDLMVEIDELTKKLGELEDQLLRYKEIETCDHMGAEYKTIYDNFIKAGFTKDEAFVLLQETLKSTIHDFMRPVRNERYTYRDYRRRY